METPRTALLAALEPYIDISIEAAAWVSSLCSEIENDPNRTPYEESCVEDITGYDIPRLWVVSVRRSKETKKTHVTFLYGTPDDAYQELEDLYASGYYEVCLEYLDEKKEEFCLAAMRRRSSVQGIVPSFDDTYFASDSDVPYTIPF